MFIQLKNHKVHIFSKMEIDTSKKSILFIPGAGMDHRILSMFKMGLELSFSSMLLVI